MEKLPTAIISIAKFLSKIAPFVFADGVIQTITLASVWKVS